MLKPDGQEKEIARVDDQARKARRRLAREIKPRR
jgi:hypothetical protein